MIHRIAETLLNGGVGVIEEAFRLCPIRELDHLLLDHTVPDILERLPQLLMKRPLEHLFDDLVPTQVLRELDHINLSIGEESVRLQAEEHQSHILWLVYSGKVFTMFIHRHKSRKSMCLDSSLNQSALNVSNPMEISGDGLYLCLQ